MANHLPEDRVRASILAAMRAAIKTGGGLGTNSLRDRGATGHDRAIRRIRDELLADGTVARPAKGTPVATPQPAEREEQPCAAEVRDARAAMRRLGITGLWKADNSSERGRKRGGGRNARNRGVIDHV